MERVDPNNARTAQDSLMDLITSIDASSILLFDYAKNYMSLSYEEVRNRLQNLLKEMS